MINVIADKYLYNIPSYLPESINLQLFDPADGFPPNISTAQALLIRTVIPVNEDTLPNIPSGLSFIGTGSAGTDHVDIQYLADHNIHFADAAGCNARSVAEYVATAMLIWAEAHQKKLQKLTVGIVGVGNVGTQVQKILQNLNIPTVCYDPPKEQREQNFNAATLDDVLECNILTFHTPITQTGNYPTYHWLDAQKLSTFNFQLIINTARGGVIDEKALHQAIAEGKVKDFIIDVWENEPQISLTTAQKAFIKTPHIAGYSIQAKENASKFIADKLINFFDLKAPDREQKEEKITVNTALSEIDSFSSLLTDLHPIKEYEKRLTAIIRKNPEKRGELFNKLRAKFPLRQQFPNIYLPAAYFDRFPALKGLGFSPIS